MKVSNGTLDIKAMTAVTLPAQKLRELIGLVACGIEGFSL